MAKELGKTKSGKKIVEYRIGEWLSELEIEVCNWISEEKVYFFRTKEGTILSEEKEREIWSKEHRRLKKATLLEWLKKMENSGYERIGEINILHGSGHPTPFTGRYESPAEFKEAIQYVIGMYKRIIKQLETLESKV